MVATKPAEPIEFTRPSDSELAVELMRLRAEDPSCGVQRLSTQLHKSNPVRKTALVSGGIIRILQFSRGFKRPHSKLYIFIIWQSWQFNTKRVRFLLRSHGVSGHVDKRAPLGLPAFDRTVRPRRES
jgi:hypothetical protein